MLKENTEIWICTKQKYCRSDLVFFRVVTKGQMRLLDLLLTLLKQQIGDV